MLLSKMVWKLEWLGSGIRKKKRINFFTVWEFGNVYQLGFNILSFYFLIRFKMESDLRMLIQYDVLYGNQLFKLIIEVIQDSIFIWKSQNKW